MYTVTKEISFCYGHRLLDYDGKCANLHGHTARAVIRLEAEQLDAQGMVVDFSEIGRVVDDWINAQLDHTMLLHRNDPFLPAMQAASERVYIMDTNPTAENIARLIYTQVKTAGYNVVEVTLWETESAGASYRE